MNRPSKERSKKTLAICFHRTARARRLASNTAIAYWRWTKRFLKFHALQHPSTLQEPAVSDYLSYLANQKKVSPSSQNQALHALRFLYKEVLGRPLALLEFPRAVKVRKRSPLCVPEIKAADLFKHIPQHIRLPFLIMYGCGLRISEALRLTIRDVFLTDKQLLLRCTKSHEDRLVPLPESLIELISQHIQRRRKEFESLIRNQTMCATKLSSHILSEWWLDELLFPSRRAFHDHIDGRIRTKPLSPQYMQREFKRACGSAGISEDLSPHSLRRSYATFLHRQGTNFREIQTLLGHKNPNTTMRYIDVTEALLVTKSPVEELLNVDCSVGTSQPHLIEVVPTQDSRMLRVFKKIKSLFQ